MLSTTVTIQEAQELMGSSTQWAPLTDLAPLRFAGYELSPRSLNEVWFRNVEMSARPWWRPDNMVNAVASLLLADPALAGLFARQRPELADLTAKWVALQGDPPEEFELEDLVLLLWTPLTEFAALPPAWQRFRTDLPAQEIRAAGGREHAQAYVLPRGLIQERLGAGVIGAGETRELLGLVFHDEAEAETTLALWERYDEGAVMSSFTTARSASRAL